MDSIPDLVLRGSQPYDNFGLTVSGGDLNGDTFSDVVVGAPGDSGDGIARGKVCIYEGSMSPDSIPDSVILGYTDRTGLGSSLANAGNLNGDDMDDIVVADQAVLVSVWVYYGAPGFDTVPDALFREARQSVRVSSAGDVNTDGYDDIIVGEPYNSQGGVEAGKIHILTAHRVGVEESQSCRPRHFCFRVFPNPFSRGTTIHYWVPPNTRVWLRVYDSSGRGIRSLLSGVLEGGTRTVLWDGRDDVGREVPTGTYFLRLATRPVGESHRGQLIGTRTATNKVCLVR